MIYNYISISLSFQEVISVHGCYFFYYVFAKWFILISMYC